MDRAPAILSLPHVRVLAQSLVERSGAEWAMADASGSDRLVILARHESAAATLQAFEGERSHHEGHSVLVGPLSPRNAAALRHHLAHLTPIPLGLQPSFGFGDRLGVATPGHIRALRRVGRGVAPLFAQQSARELLRTGRTAAEVLDAATWGAFREGWTAGVGADADHLKTTADIDAYLDAGFSMFTIDPGDYVGTVSAHASIADLQAKFEGLPWTRLDDRPTAAFARYVDHAFDIEGRAIRFESHTLLGAAVKYGGAVAHVASMYRHLLARAGSRPIELEVSVDETDAPTTHAEHVYVATELRRLGVTWASLAPRLVGRFEKGVDYIGDHAAFEADWALHAAIARALGPYKLSLHSGSDKFSIYDAVARHSRGLVHVKTAGTSWIEALRTLAAVDPRLFREVYVFGREHYAADRASYHVSGRVEAAPPPEALTDAQLPSVLDDFHARQILHVTFGSVLKAADQDGERHFYNGLMAALRAGADLYASNLEAHFVRHVRPFAPQSPTPTVD
jgi:hypothetical protein